MSITALKKSKNWNGGDVFGPLGLKRWIGSNASIFDLSFICLALRRHF